MPLQWERPIFDLHARLKADADAVSDAEARAAVEHIAGAVQGSCDSCAHYLFFSIALVCRSKPHLTHEMLIHAVRPLYYLGVQASEDAAAWVRYFLANPMPCEDSSVAGRLWMEELLLDTAPLQLALSDVAAEERAEDGDAV